MSCFLSAAENVARQRQNVRCDLKKKMEEESRAVELASESHNLFIFWFVLYRKRFQLQKDNYIYIFGTIVTLLKLDGR